MRHPKPSNDNSDSGRDPSRDDRRSRDSAQGRPTSRPTSRPEGRADGRPEGRRNTRPEGRPAGRLGPPVFSAASPSDRPAQMGGEIRRAVQAELARGLNDPRVQGMISITEVVVTPDLQEAKLMVSVLPEERASLTLSGLRAAAGFVRRKVLEETRFGRVPKIVFELDVRLKRQAALDSLIREGESKHASGAIEPASETDAQPEDSVEPTTHKQTRRGETNALENDSR